MLSDDRQRGLEGPAATEQELAGEWFAQWLSKVNCVFGQDVEDKLRSMGLIVACVWPPGVHPSIRPWGLAPLATYVS